MFTAQILLIDDHIMFRSGLRMVLHADLPDADFFEAGSLNEAIRNGPEHLNVILLDIKMPGLNGVEGLTLIKRKWPQVPVLMLSSQDEPETVRLAIARGATDFISKADTAKHIVKLIMHILRGEVSVIATTQIKCHETIQDNTPHLTARQCEVLELLYKGLSNKLIARHLNLSENTVRGHVQAILDFLQVSSRSEASVAAHRCGLVR